MLAQATDYKLTDHDILTHSSSEEYVLRVKDLPNDEKPREKLLSGGARTLNLAELVAIMWGVGTRKEEVLAMAQRVLKEYGEKALSRESDPRQLAEALNIPETKACQIIAGLELGRRFYAETDGKPAFVRNAEQAFAYLNGIGHSRKEQLRGIYLNSRYQVIHDEVISIGSVSSNVVHPREVFAPALEHGAIAIIIAHNHPSGNNEPTDADLEVTAQLRLAGQLIGIELLDHLIIAGETYKSIKE